MALDFVVHGPLLESHYYALQHLYRTPEEAQNYFMYMLLAHLLMSIAFVWIYTKGREQKPFLEQGVRYGLAVALLMTIPTYLIYYAVMPLPGVMVVKQIVFSTIEVLILGIAVAWLNR
jgi:hypothetical protein